jgi:hypothetical protein
VYEDIVGWGRVEGGIMYDDAAGAGRLELLGAAVVFCLAMLASASRMEDPFVGAEGAGA